MRELILRLTLNLQELRVREEGFSTAELLGNAALGIIALVAIWGLLKVLGQDVVEFIKAQRRSADGRVVRLHDGSGGVSARTIRRRLSSVSGFYDYLLATGVRGVRANPVPRGLTRRVPGEGPSRRALIPSSEDAATSAQSRGG